MDVWVGLTDREPEVVFVPLQAPLAVHVLAPADCQLITLVPPEAIEAGDAVNVMAIGVLRVKLPVALISFEDALDESSESLPPHAGRANKTSNRIGRRFIVDAHFKNFSNSQKEVGAILGFLKAKI